MILVNPILIKPKLSANHATVDISQKLFNLWTAPVQYDIKLLQAYLDEPLSPDWKVPLSHFDWKQLLFSEAVRDHACSDQDLELLFNQCDDESASAIRMPLLAAITSGPPDLDSSKASFHSFWDANFRNILAPCLGGKTIRNSNQGTATELFRPDFGLLLTDACIFRGEEKRVTFTGDVPKAELGVKTRWVYDPAPNILGYHAVGPVVVLSAILPQGGSLRVVDLIRADLSTRRDRIKNASRMIRMCGILRYLLSVIGEGKDRDMFLQIHAGGKLLKFFTSFVRKTYGIEDEVDGEERVKHLRAIYAALASKGVPNVDRLKDSKIRDYTRGSYVDLEPRGIDQSPESSTDIRNAVMCILQTLKACHASDPQVFHRDIRWRNVIRNKEDPTNWFLIDWEDASFAPTRAAQHLNRIEHSPKVFEDNHGAEVDMWGVGRLIVTAQMQIPALQDLGRKMMRGDVLNAEQGLEEINDIQVVV
ncbi:hypothetical protein APHAL10511_002983 [Amanita phalloides]|nr:hypothetical protein APHAL10511_002983 [Amanita phalloides]